MGQLNKDLERRVREIPGVERMSSAKVAKTLGVPLSQLRTIMLRLKSGAGPTAEQCGQLRDPQETREFSGNTGVIGTVRENVRTLEDLLAYMQVDLAVWEVERYTANKWEVGAKDESKIVRVTPLYQVKAWLRRKTPTVVNQAFENLLKQFQAGSVEAPRIQNSKLKAQNRYLLELALYDAHFGLLAWNKETGENYDLNIAAHRYAAAADDLLEKTKGCRPEKILIPVGNDFFHINNPDAQTPRGHNILDVDGRLCKVIEVGERALILAVERCAQVAPVEVMWIPGNHDPETSYFMCRILKAHFHNNPNVTVDVSPAPRKYRRYGCNLIGFTHGNEERQNSLPAIMAGERRADWAVATCMEWHTGHFHKKKETHFLAGDTIGNVVVRTIPSIAGMDAWHFRKGYVEGRRVAEAFLFDFAHGLAAQYTSRDLREK